MLLVLLLKDQRLLALPLVDGAGYWKVNCFIDTSHVGNWKGNTWIPHSAIANNPHVQPGLEPATTTHPWEHLILLAKLGSCGCMLCYLFFIFIFFFFLLLSYLACLHQACWNCWRPGPEKFFFLIFNLFIKLYIAVSPKSWYKSW